MRSRIRGEQVQMNTQAPTAVLLVGIVGALAACAPKHIPTPAAPAMTRVVLLRDAESDSVGRARVTTASGSVDLRADRDSTSVTANGAPGQISSLSEPDVTHMFGDALSALPSPPARFTLNFRLGLGELTDESRALVTDVLQAIRRRSTPYVTVIGHTDTTGQDPENFVLGLTRAKVVQDLLIQTGLDPSSIEVISLGERDLLIHTADETPEPRNRRVEIAIR